VCIVRESRGRTWSANNYTHIHKTGYYDSQNIVACTDPHTGEVVLSVILHHSHNHEGGAGLRLYHTISRDQGRSWTALKPVEPSLTIQSHDGYQLVHENRVFVFYGFNEGDLRHGDLDLPRSDMQLKDGYWFRYTDDCGKTFSRRYRVPVRRTQIDRENAWKGEIMGMFCCDKPSIIGDYVYFAFQKTREGGGETPGSEVFFMRSKNVLVSPDHATWETLPNSDKGLQSPSGRLVLGEEPHIMQVDSKNPRRVFALWRCEVGRIACTYSSDGGLSWDEPFWMTYSGTRDGTQIVRNPRGSLTPHRLRKRTQDGRLMYLLIFYNNGHTERDGYVGRRVYWFVVGTESKTKPKTLTWSQPEIALYWDGEAMDDRPDWSMFDIGAHENFSLSLSLSHIYTRTHTHTHNTNRRRLGDS